MNLFSKEERNIKAYCVNTVSSLGGICTSLNWGDLMKTKSVCSILEYKETILGYLVSFKTDFVLL